MHLHTAKRGVVYGMMFLMLMGAGGIALSPLPYTVCWRRNHASNQATCCRCGNAIGEYGTERHMLMAYYTSPFGRPNKVPLPIGEECIQKYGWPLPPTEQSIALHNWRTVELLYLEELDFPPPIAEAKRKSILSAHCNTQKPFPP